MPSVISWFEPDETTCQVATRPWEAALRLQNISAVLHELGLPWIDGYKPLSHYPERLRQLIERATSLGNDRTRS